jgi:hypothetical protein
MRTSLLILMLTVLAGCSSHTTARVKTDRALTAEEMRIVEIARRAVAMNGTRIDRAEFERPQRADSGWSVLVWDLPKTPGGHQVIFIDENGKVTKSLPGL